MSERLPRMRGDRPRYRYNNGFLFRATPHARGSTFIKLVSYGVWFGYPACAGIDLPFTI